MLASLPKVPKSSVRKPRKLPYHLPTDLTPNLVTLNDPEWPFCVKFCFAPVILELLSLAFEACYS